MQANDELFDSGSQKHLVSGGGGPNQQQKLASIVRNNENSYENQLQQRKQLIEHQQRRFAGLSDSSIGSQLSVVQVPKNLATSKTLKENLIQRDESHEEQRLIAGGGCSCNSSTSACCNRCHKCIRCNCICNPTASNSNMSTKSQTTRLIPAYFVAEMIGTFLLVVSTIDDGCKHIYLFLFYYFLSARLGERSTSSALKVGGGEPSLASFLCPISS